MLQTFITRADTLYGPIPFPFVARFVLKLTRGYDRVAQNDPRYVPLAHRWLVGQLVGNYLVLLCQYIVY